MCVPPDHAAMDLPRARAADERTALTGAKGDYARLPGVVVSARAAAAARPAHRSILRLAAVPFGGHCFKNSLSALQPLLALDATTYGYLASTIALPSATIAPLVGGVLYDCVPNYASAAFAAVAFGGGATCAVGLAANQAPLAFGGGAILGLGQGCVVVACRAIASTFEDQAFAQGLLAAVANVAGFAAKASAAPVALHFHSAAAPLAIVVGVQGLSLLAATDAAVRGACCPCGPQTRPPARHYAQACRFLKSERFWLVALAHAALVVAFKVFENFSSAILVERFGYHVSKAGFMSSVVPLTSAVLTPACGLLADRSRPGRRNAATAAAMVLAAAAFGCLAKPAGPRDVAFAFASVSLGHAVLPTLLLARVRGTVSLDNVGAAFGACETLASFGHVVANVAFALLHVRGEGEEMLLLLVLVAFGLLLFLRLLWVQQNAPATPPRPPHDPENPLSVRTPNLTFVT